MLPIGLTTGFAYNELSPVSRKVIEACRKMGARAIELNLIGGFENNSLSSLSNLKLSDFKGFDHVSLHAPSKNVKYRLNKNGNLDKSTKKILDILQAAYFRLNFCHAVFHSDIVVDWEVFSGYTFPVAIENVDNRVSYQGVAEMRKVFKAFPRGKFVLDINHCYVNDHSMKLAYNLFAAFRDILCEIHISGYAGYHAPFAKTEKSIRNKILGTLVKILKQIPSDKIPIHILENNCKSVKEAETDFRFLVDFLRGEGL